MTRIGPIEALGTVWWFEVFDQSIEQNEVTNYLKERLLQFDQDYSRFRAESYVGQLNLHKTLSDPPAELIELIHTGIDWYKKSNGLFNFMTADTQVEQGYGDIVPTEIYPQIGNPETDIRFSNSSISITNGSIDLGGCGKGYLIDSIAKELPDKFAIEHFLINGGGDMYASSDQKDKPVTITIEHPIKQQTYIARIPLHHSAFAASSTYKRNWKHNNLTKTHILDPKNTDQTILDTASHVVSDTALQADILATILCIQPRFPINNAIRDSFLVMPSTGKSLISPQFRNWLLD